MTRGEGALLGSSATGPLACAAASGGAYTLGRDASGWALSCEERLPVRGRRLAVTLGAGAALAAALFGAHYALSAFSSELRYGLLAAPCVHPALGLALAYVVARRVVRPEVRASSVWIGARSTIDGEPVGALRAVDLDTAESRVTLHFEAGAAVELACREPSDAVALAHALEASVRPSRAAPRRRPSPAG